MRSSVEKPVFAARTSTFAWHLTLAPYWWKFQYFSGRSCVILHQKKKLPLFAQLPKLELWCANYSFIPNAARKGKDISTQTTNSFADKVLLVFHCEVYLDHIRPNKYVFISLRAVARHIRTKSVKRNASKQITWVKKASEREAVHLIKHDTQFAVLLIKRFCSFTLWNEALYSQVFTYYSAFLFLHALRCQN